MQLIVNMLIQFINEDGSPGHIERVLWVDENSKQAVTIEILGRTSLPKFREADNILALLSLGDVIALSDDPHVKLFTENSITEKERSIRDRAWEIVQVVAGTENQPQVFYPSHRAELIKKTSALFGVSEKTVRSYLRRFWQRGQHKNALVPDYRAGAMNRSSTLLMRK